MNKTPWVIFLAVLLSFSFGCQKSEEKANEPVVDIRADIEANKILNEAWDEAYSTRDMERLLSLYTDDAVRIPPNEPALGGKTEIRKNFQQVFDMYTEENDSEVEDIKISGDLAFVRGPWKVIQTPIGGGEPVNLNGSFVAINQKQADGEWKTICEIWSIEQLILPSQEKP